MRLLVVTALTAAVLALAACGGDDGDDGRAPATWDGPPDAAADGSVPVEDFNGLLEGDRRDWARTPLIAGAAFAGERERPPGEGPGGVSVAEERPEHAGERTVHVTDDGLADDSVRAVRWTLRLERVERGRWRLLEARRTQRCQPGRGHRHFSPEPCL